MDFEMVSISDAKVRLHELVGRAASRAILFLRHSRPAAVLLSYDHWRQLNQELEDLRGRLSIYRSKESPPDLRLSHDKLRVELGLMHDEEEES